MRVSLSVLVLGISSELNLSLSFPLIFLSIFPPSFLFPSLPQAQAVLNESSQKLDLLKYSLEQRLSELPKNHPKISEVKEELAMVASPPLSPRQSIISTYTQYSTVAKPAALTGMTRQRDNGHAHTCT